MHGFQAAASAQGLSPDALLGRVMTAKTEVRRALLKRHMAALDEAEGLQDITTRLSERMGVGAQARVVAGFPRVEKGAVSSPRASPSAWASVRGSMEAVMPFMHAASLAAPPRAAWHGCTRMLLQDAYVSGYPQGLFPSLYLR